VPFWPLDSGSEIRDRKKVSIRIRDLEYFLEFRNHFLWLKILDADLGSGMGTVRIRDPGWVKIRIRDPG